jgi:hypothetical protein
MPVASRNQKQKARIKRELSNYKRAYANVVQGLQRNTMLVMMLLQQAGGTVEISEGLGKTIMENLGNLSFDVQEPTEDQKGLVFATLVLKEKTSIPVADKVPAKPAVQITYPEGQSAEKAVVD